MEHYDLEDDDYDVPPVPRRRIRPGSAGLEPGFNPPEAFQDPPVPRRQHPKMKAPAERKRQRAPPPEYYEAPPECAFRVNEDGKANNAMQEASTKRANFLWGFANKQVHNKYGTPRTMVTYIPHSSCCTITLSITCDMSIQNDDDQGYEMSRM